MSLVIAWIGGWVEAMRVVPPFSRRRRELLAAIAEAEAKR